MSKSDLHSLEKLAPASVLLSSHPSSKSYLWLFWALPLKEREQSKVNISLGGWRGGLVASCLRSPMGSFSFLRREMRRDLERERRSVVVPEWAVVHSEVSCSDWLLVSLAALWDLNIFLQKSFLPRRAPGICSSLKERRQREGGWTNIQPQLSQSCREREQQESFFFSQLGTTWCCMETLWGGHSLFGCLGGSAGDVAATLICSTGHLTLLPGHTRLWPAHTHPDRQTNQLSNGLELCIFTSSALFPAKVKGNNRIWFIFVDIKNPNC